MIKVFAIWTRRSDMTHDEAVKYWLEKHAPLVKKTWPFIKKYITNIGLPFNYTGWSEDEAPPYDGMAEFWFDVDMETFKEKMQSKEYYEILAPDEKNFIGTWRAMIVEEITQKE